MSKVHWPLFLIFLFTCSTVLLGVVKGNPCLEDMGGCDPQCQTGCAGKHPSGQSSCDATTKMCKCLYQRGEPIAPPPPPPPPLPPPKGKTCHVGIGPCSAKCYDDCCNEKCAERFAGYLQGHGSCESPIGPARFNVCMCYFQC